MLEFIKEALDEFAECHDSRLATRNDDGRKILLVLIDSGDGTEPGWFEISARAVSDYNPAVD